MNEVDLIHELPMWAAPVIVASVVLTVFNALLQIWPMVAMNLALCLINAWFLRKLISERHDEHDRSRRRL